MSCLGENTILGFISGELTTAAAVSAEEHFAACADCRALLVTAADDGALGRMAEHSESDPSLGGPPRLSAFFGKFELGEELGGGGMGVVHRARIVGTNQWVALKRVRLPNRRLLVHALHREIEALRRLKHPGVVRILEQGTLEGVPYYTMELLAGTRLDRRIQAAHRGVGTSAQDVWALLRIVRLLCDTLRFLHSEGVIHRDLTPRNIIVSADDTPVLVDFGLALAREDTARDQVERELLIAGTRPYMSPEQLHGDPLDERTDLYAIGCLLNEILTGHPQVTDSGPRHGLFCSQSALDTVVQARLEALARHLVAPRRSDRPAYAEDVARELDEICGWQSADSGARHSRAYVYRPELVGRTALLDSLEQRLRASKSGRGAMVLVAGESGVGKTRFSLEVAARARRAKVRVVTSGCAPRMPPTANEAGEWTGEALQALRGVLRAVADTCRRRGPKTTDLLLGPRGKVLSICDPELATLPGQHAYPEPSSLPADAARYRLLSALEQTIRAFSELGPLLLVLDDLQWVDELSLAFLEAIRPEFLDHQGIVILAGYRSEDVSSATREVLLRLADEHHVLPRLSPQLVAEMTGHMLATSEVPEKLLETVTSASDGNPFFVTEYVTHAVNEGLLVREQSGRWAFRSHDGGGRAVVAPTSLRELLERRLMALSPTSRKLVQFAAVLPSPVDENLLAHAPTLSAEEALSARAECVRHKVLEPIPHGRLRFIHDKLRETVLSNLKEIDAVDLHRAAALAIERTYPDRAWVAAQLAHHWQMALEPARELEHRVLAGERAFELGAYRDAIPQLERALELMPRADAVVRARVQRALAEAYFGAGDMAASRRGLEDALSRLGLPVPTTTWAMMLASARELLGYTLRQLSKSTAADRLPREALTQAARSYERLAHVLFFENQPIGVLTSSIHAVTVASRLGNSPELARGYANLSLATAFTPLRRLSQPLSVRARDVAEQIGDAAARAWALQIDGVFRAGIGEWASAATNLETALAIWSDIGDRRRWEETLTLLGMTQFQSGDRERAASLRRRIEQAGRESGSAQTIGWALVGDAEAKILDGSWTDALTLLDRAAALGPALRRVEQIWMEGLRARASLAAGSTAAALAAANRALALIESTQPTAFYVLDGYSGVAEVYLSTFERERHAAPHAPYVERARRAIRWMSRFANVFPIAEPRAHLLRGAWRALHGNPKSARRMWVRGVDVAQRLQRRDDERLLLAKLASLSDRKSHLGFAT